MDEFMKSQKFKIAAISVGSVILALFIFAAGVTVGIHKARFSEKFARNYERNFAPTIGGPMGFMRDIEGREFRNAHGIAGKVISVSENNIIIKDIDDKESTVSVSDKTIIKRGRDSIKITDVKNDDRIVVMGRPGDNGTVEADLIRVFQNNQ